MKSSDVRTQCSRSSNMYQACILCVCYAVIVSSCYHMVLIVLKGNCLNLDKNVKTDPLRAVVIQVATPFSLVSVATKKQNF